MKPPSSTTEGRTRLLDGLFTTPAMALVFSDRGCIQRLLDFEAALARAEAVLGIIPRTAAELIASECRADLFDMDALSQDAAVAGNLAIPVVRMLIDLVGKRDSEAARWVHWGATSQDAIDTGLVLQLRAALDLLDADLERLSAALANLAERHRHTVQLGRTWLQPGPPITFGLKAVGWLSAVERQRERMTALRARVLVIQFGGAVGTLAALGTQGLAVATGLGLELGLAVPHLPWHAHRDCIAEAGAALGLLTGSLGKIARDVSLLMQAELAEAFEPRARGRGGSSTMPHKQNPVGAAAILSAAARVPSLVSTLLSAMPQEHERGLGGWHAEWETLPEICRLTAGALKHAVDVCEGLEVDAERMRANLDATGGIVWAEPVALALARHMDRIAAHSSVEKACRRASAEKKPLRRALDDDLEVTSRLSPEELDQLCDPSTYLGLADEWVDRVLASCRPRHASKKAVQTIEVPGATLHFRLDGPDRAPVLVLANSLGTSLAMWGGQMAALTRAFRVLRYDMRGHGASSVSTPPVDIACLGRDVLSLLDAIEATNAHFVGLSLGGMVGLWLGVNAPARMKSLVLSNTAARIGTTDSWNARIAAVERSGMEPVVETVLARWFTARFREQAPERVDPLRSMLLAMDCAGYVAGCAAVRDADLRDSVASVRVPTLVITGAHDSATPPSDGRWLAERIAGANHVELRTAHLGNVEAESAFNHSVVDFLSAQEKRHGRA